MALKVHACLSCSISHSYITCYVVFRVNFAKQISHISNSDAIFSVILEHAGKYCCSFISLEQMFVLKGEVYFMDVYKEHLKFLHQS